jgi:integrase
MANGSVVRYEGKRGTVYRIKYRDASGKQVQETLGNARDGWSERRANQALTNKLADVDRENFVKPAKTSFEDLARRYLNDYMPGRNLKRTTRESYRQTIEGHLIPFFRDLELQQLESRPELIDRYITEKTKAGLSAKTIRNHLATLGVVLRRALAWKLIRTNPLASVERPRVTQPEMTVLSEDEIATLLQSFTTLMDAAGKEAKTRQWWLLARTITLVGITTGLRRGELLGLRWRDVDFAKGLLHVRQTIVRGRIDTPKTKTSRRTVELAPQCLAALTQHRDASEYSGDDEFVFCHPKRGTPTDPSKLSKGYLRPALAHAGINQAFRPFHDLRHTAITYDAVAGNPQAYIQMRAGHSSGTITERYIHAAQVMFPGAAARTEALLLAKANPPTA